MTRSLSLRHTVATALFSVFFLPLSGCTPTEAKIAAELSTALNDFIQNKAIVEETVREVKAACPNGDADPACERAHSLYDNAREMNDQLVSLLEAGAKPSTVRSIQGAQPRTVRDAAVRFVSQGSSIISPGLDTRSIPFDQTIIVPEGLLKAVRKVDSTSRALMADQYKQQIRWDAWDSIGTAGSTVKKSTE